MILEVGNITEAAQEALARIFDTTNVDLMGGDDHEWELDVTPKKLESVLKLLNETRHDLNNVASIITIKINHMKDGTNYETEIDRRI